MPSTRPSSSPAVLPHPTDKRALAPGLRLGEYELERVLGEGTDGILYLAHDHGLQRRVALREYLPQGLAGRGSAGEVGLLAEGHAGLFATGLSAFAAEARLLARCEHPALLKALRYWEARGTGYMALQWYEGESLQASRTAMPLPPGEPWLRALLLDLLGALDALHAAFAQHRGVTPGKILLQPDGKPVLLGLNAARRVLSEQGAATATPADEARYAPLEALPEGSHLQQGPWSDLYSLAAVGYFCLTGSPPPSVVERARDGAARPLSAAARAQCARHPGLQYSAPFLAALDWAFELQPQDRPRSVAELRAVLQQGGGPARAGPVPVGIAAPSVVATRGTGALGGLPARAGAVLALHGETAAPPKAAQTVAPPPVDPSQTTAAAASASPLAREAAAPPAAESAVSAAEPSDDAVRAALAVALDSLPPTPSGRLPRDGHEQRPVERPAASHAAPLPRRWLWPAAAVLALTATAAGWQWKQQEDARALSRAMTGAVTSAVTSAPPAAEMPTAAAPNEQRAEGEQALPLDPLPAKEAPVAVAELAPPPADGPGRDAEAGVPPDTPAPAGATPPGEEQIVPDKAPAVAAATTTASTAVDNAGVGSSPASGSTAAVDGKAAAPRPAKKPVAAPAAPKRVQFDSPRAACAPRQRFSLYYCMQQQCKKPHFYKHRQCVLLREHDEIE